MNNNKPHHGILKIRSMPSIKERSKKLKFKKPINRTTSDINFSYMQRNKFKQKSNSSPFNLTNFAFKLKTNSKTNEKLKPPISNYISMSDFLEKIKNPLEKHREMLENFRDEQKRIRAVLSNLIYLDDERVLNECKSAKNLEQNDFEQKINNYLSKSQALMNSEINSKDEKIFKLFNLKNQLNSLEKSQISKGTINNEKKIKLTKLKFSVFDKDYSPIKTKSPIKKEKDKKKLEEEKINRFKEKEYLIEFQREHRKVELLRRDEISSLYKIIIINKLKKKKFTEVLDQTYRLLDKARTEYTLSVDILKERIKSVQKYYSAFIAVKIENKKSFRKNSSNITNSVQSSENESENVQKKGRKKTILNIYEEKTKLYREYLTISEDINNEIQNYEKKFELIKFDLDNILKESSEKIEQLSIKTKKLKYLFKELNNQQIQYYLNILKKGTDTRLEGLSWVVKRLMELDVQIDYSLFPGFLDQEQIDYIIQISKLGYELIQLKQILESLRDRQNDKRLEGKNLFGNRSLKKFFKKRGSQIAIFDLNFNVEDLTKDINFLNRNYINNFHLKINKVDPLNKGIHEILENTKIEEISKELKKRIMKYSSEENESFKRKYENKNEIISHLLSHANEKHKDYLQDVITLNERIKRVDDFISKMRKEEFLIFEEKFKFGELKDEQSKNLYDKVFNALFGSSSLEFSGFLKSIIPEN